MTGLWAITEITTYHGRGTKVDNILDGLGLLAMLLGLAMLAGLAVVGMVCLILLFIGVLP